MILCINSFPDTRTVKLSAQQFQTLNYNFAVFHFFKQTFPHKFKYKRKKDILFDMHIQPSIFFSNIELQK